MRTDPLMLLIYVILFIVLLFILLRVAGLAT